MIRLGFEPTTAKKLPLCKLHGIDISTAPTHPLIYYGKNS